MLVGSCWLCYDMFPGRGVRAHPGRRWPPHTLFHQLQVNFSYCIYLFLLSCQLLCLLIYCAMEMMIIFFGISLSEDYPLNDKTYLIPIVMFLLSLFSCSSVNVLLVRQLVANFVLFYFRRPQFFLRTADVTGSVFLPEGVEMVRGADIISCFNVSLRIFVFLTTMILGYAWR